MPSQNSLPKRFPCPCCGFPTIDEPGNYNICEICNWEDDGQGDKDADKVKGGPNSDYSLTEARINFKQFGVMYRPNHDQRITGPDNDKQTCLKAELKTEFNSWRSANVTTRIKIESRILNLEKELFSELKKRVHQYETRQPSA